MFVLATSAHAQNGIRGQVVSVSSVRLGRIEVIPEKSGTFFMRTIERWGLAHLMLANVYMKQQDWNKAVQQFDAYLKDNPNAADRDQIKDTRAKIASRIPK